MTTKSTAVDKFLLGLSAEQFPVCEKLRKLVLDNMPGTIELMAHGAPGYSTTTSSFDRIAYIQPHSQWVNLGFFFGVDIPDPENILEGTGERMRHVKIKNIKDAGNPAIKQLIKEAWKKAPADIEQLHARKKRK